MKKSFALLAVLFALPALAQDPAFDLPEGALAIAPIDGRVVDVSTLCPEGNFCILNGTEVTIQFTLGGCMDVLAPVVYEAIQADGKLQVFVHAQNIRTRASMLSRCVEMPVVTQRLVFVNQYGDVKVRFMGLGIDR